MAVVLGRDERYEKEIGEGAVIHGRPDLDRGFGFGVTRAKRHPPYVFSTHSCAALVHKIAYVELHWWSVSNCGHDLIKLRRPVMIAMTMCQYHFRLEAKRNRTCLVPSADALLCGRCHGDPAPFGRHGSAKASGKKRVEYHVKLGCAVKGY